MQGRQIVADDPDLPGDECFQPASTIGIVEVPNPYGGPGLLAQVSLNTVSVEAQQAIHHNRLRYQELEKLRRGQTNLYQETRYR
jgi:hypothetical protein